MPRTDSDGVPDLTELGSHREQSVGSSGRLWATKVRMKTPDSIMGSAYAPYTARLPPNAHLPGLLRSVHFVNGFFRMRRESGRVLMYNGTHIRIRTGNGMIW